MYCNAAWQSAAKVVLYNRDPKVAAVGYSTVVCANGSLANTSGTSIAIYTIFYIHKYVYVYDTYKYMCLYMYNYMYMEYIYIYIYIHLRRYMSACMFIYTYRFIHIYKV